MLLLDTTFRVCLNLTTIKNIEIPLLNIEEQNSLISSIDKLEKRKVALSLILDEAEQKKLNDFLKLLCSIVTHKKPL